MTLGKKVEYKPYNGIGCYTRVYVHGVMHVLINNLISYSIITRIMFGLEFKIVNNRIIINEIR